MQVANRAVDPNLKGLAIETDGSNGVKDTEVLVQSSLQNDTRHPACGGISLAIAVSVLSVRKGLTWDNAIGRGDIRQVITRLDAKGGGMLLIRLLVHKLRLFRLVSRVNSLEALGKLRLQSNQLAW